MNANDELLKLQELNLRNRLQHALPAGTCGPEPCRPTCAVGYKDIPGPPSMIAQKGNPKFKPGTIHDQCLECHLREKNATAIRELKWELGIR